MPILLVRKGKRMSLNQIISIENDAHINIDTGRLCLHINNKKHFFSLSDIAVLCLDNPRISISKSVLQSCSMANVSVLITDEKHMPAMMCTPYNCNQQIAMRSFQQAYLWGSEYLLQCWRHVLISKLHTQAYNLSTLHLNGGQRILDFACQIKPGDPDLIEAKAAREYWRNLFGEKFIRHKQGASDPINIRLNYGYAIIRAAMARTIASYGLQPAFGIGHKRKDNPFNLVEDMVEPFRFLVDKCVYEMDYSKEFSSQDRGQLIRTLDNTISMNGQTYRAFAAMDAMIQSFCRCIENPRVEIDLLLPYVEIQESKYKKNVLHENTKIF